MTKTLEQFKTDTMGGRFGVPGTSNANLGDPAYAGQCVSYVRLYMEEVLGIKTAVWGNAVSYWTNPGVLAHFDKVAQPQDGDIVVWGDDVGNWTGPEGHIAIWYKGQLLNQNFGGSLRVTINNHFTQGLLGYLRPKDNGGDMEDIITDKHVALIRVMSSEVKGWNRDEVHSGKFDDREMKAWKGKKLSHFSQQAWDEGGSYRDLKDKWKAAYDAQPGLLKKVDELEAQLKAIPANTTDAEAKLRAIRDALGIK